jgi:hypothetical protein
MYFINGFINIKIVLIMRKKYFLAKLAIYGFLTLGAATTFVGCKDYDGDITDLQTQIDDNKADYTSVLTEKLAAVNTQITTLQGTQTALQATVATAQTAANAAKTSADAAAAAAAAAQLAAAQAKLDAINTAASALATVKTALETRISTLDGKFAALQESVSKGATKDELTALNAGLLKEIANAKSSIEAELTTISGQISAVDSKYNTLVEKVETLATKSEVEASLASLKTELAALYLQQATFNKYEAIVGTKLDSDSTKIVDLQKQITDLSAQLTSSIATAKNEAVAEAVNKALAADAQQAVTLEAMWKAYIATQLDNYVDKSTYEAAVAAVNNKLETLSASIDANLNTMNAIFSHRLTSMAFVPEYYVGGVPAVIFATLNYKDLDKGTPLNATMNSQAKYRMNPNGVMPLDVKDFVFTGEKAQTKGLGTDAPAPISVVGQPTVIGGVFTFNISKTGKFADSPKFDIVSLKATLADKALTSAEKEANTCVAVYSDYVRAYEEFLSGDNLDIAKKTDLSSLYPKNQSAAEGIDPANAPSFVYNEELDLMSIVASSYKINNTYNPFNESAYGLCYKFTLMDYPLTSGNVTTNQKDFAKIKEDGHTLVAKVYDDPASVAAAGRTPIVKVELVDKNGIVVKRSFLKVKINAKTVAPIDVPTVEATIVLGCENEILNLKVDAEMMNKEVYAKLGMNHTQAMDIYGPSSSVDPTSPITNKPYVNNNVLVNGVYTTEIWWNIPYTQFGLIKDGGSEFVGHLTCAPKYPDTDLPKINFTFKVKVLKPNFAILGKNYAMWDSQHTAFKAVIPSLNYDPANCNYSSDLRSAFNTDDAGNVRFTPEENVPGCGGLKFKILSTNPATASLIKIVGNYIVFNHSTANQAALSELDKTTLYATVQPYYEWTNGNIVNLEKFNVQFIKPFSAFNVSTEKNFTDLVTGGSNISYKDIDFTVKDYKDQVVNYLSPAWFFYGLGNYGLGYKDLEISNITTNLDGTTGNLVPTEGVTNGILPAGITITKESSPFGTYLKYLNTSSVAFTSPYKVFIHYRLPHFWGTLGTIGNDGVLAIVVDNRPSVGTR